MQGSRFVFGSFVLDPGAGTLRENDAPVSASYRGLRLLAALAARPDEILSKAELLDAGIQSDRIDRDESWNSTLREQLMLAEVTVSSVLAQKRIDLRQLTRLKVGDILPIELPSSVPVCVEDIPVFTGEFGLSHGRNAVKIVQTRPPGAPQPRTANFSEESPA